MKILCKCGCGKPTKIAYRNLKRLGWIKGQPINYVLGHNPTRKMLGKHLSPEHKEKLRKLSLGRKMPKEWVERMKIERLGKGNPMYGKKNPSPRWGQIPWNKGKDFPQVKGNKNKNWNGGITPLYMQIRHHRKLKEWAALVKKRDNYTCQFCKSIGGRLHSDHIKPFAIIIRENNIKSLEDALLTKELFDLNNGRTLCLGCHKQTDTYSKAFYKRYRYEERMWYRG